MAIREFAKKYFNNKTKTLRSFIGTLGLCGFSIREISNWLKNDMEINLSDGEIEEEIEVESSMWKY